MIEAPCPPQADYGECARPVEYGFLREIQQGELEHFQNDVQQGIILKGVRNYEHGTESIVWHR